MMTGALPAPLAPPAHRPASTARDRPSALPTGSLWRDASCPTWRPSRRTSTRCRTSFRSSSAVVGGLVYETLIECRENQYRAGLAESWDVSPDGERITVKLRSGARWHDDGVVSGMDVQATFEPLLRAASRQSVFHAMLEDVEGVDVLPERARFRLRRPSDLVLRALCEIPILPAESLRKAGSAATQLGRQPVGTGPFRFSSWEHGKRIRLVRSRPAERPRPPFLDEIVFEIDW